MSREGADARLGRLLAVVPWIAAHDGPTVAEVCERFGVSERDLLADLNLLFMCGVYPFTPDVLIDVDVADGRVWVRMADYFRRPLRLTRQEAVAMVSAGQVLLQMPGSDPEGALSTALDKLQRALGFGDEDVLDVELEEIQPALLESLRSSAEQHHKIRMDYYSFGRDRHSVRVVHPWRVFNSGGQWYLSGFCENVRDERLFRLDRIRSLERTDQSFDAFPTREESDLPAELYHPSPDDRRWVLDLSPDAHWIAEQYPNDSVESRPGGILRVSLRVGESAWMERVLLRAGPSVRVVEGDGGLPAAAAARLLRRYGHVG